MKISEKWTYPADADAVWAMTTDQRFQDQKCADAGALSATSRITESGDRTVIVNEREMPTEGVPDVLTKIVGRTVQVTESQTWGGVDAAGVRTAELEVVLKGQPITMKGTATISPEGDTTTVTVDADLKAGIPLIGGKIEKAAAPSILAAIRSEQQTGTAYLAD